VSRIWEKGKRGRAGPEDRRKRGMREGLCSRRAADAVFKFVTQVTTVSPERSTMNAAFEVVTPCPAVTGGNASVPPWCTSLLQCAAAPRLDVPWVLQGDRCVASAMLVVETTRQYGLGLATPPASEEARRRRGCDAAGLGRGTTSPRMRRRRPRKRHDDAAGPPDL